MTAVRRDLATSELWERSLERSRLRRALAPRVRREHKRRKRLSAAAAAATMAGPGAPMALAQIPGDIQAEVASETTSKRAIEIRDGGLPLQVGSQGDLVAHVQRALQIPADGVFGMQTDTAVRQYQIRAGLQVDGIVGPATWASLFESGSAVGASNVSTEVKQRIEQKLAVAGQQFDAQSQGTTTTPAVGTPVEETTRVPAGGGDADEVPAGGQSDTPSSGGAVEETAPVSGACGSTVSTPVNGTVTSEFGPRWGRNHDGVDIAAPTGTAVRAAACGSVSLAGTQDGYGNIVCVTHTSEFSTCYAHLSRFATSQGAQVQQGQVIGYVGCTGSCTGPHLHFETRVNGQAQNPRGYLTGTSIPGASASTAKASTSTAPAQTAVGPTTPTAPPGTPEAMIGETAPAPAEAAPVAPAPAPVEAAPVPVEAAPVPVEAAPVPVAPAPVPVEAAPVPVEAAPVPVAPAPVPVEAAPVPVAPAPVPVEAAPVAPVPAPAPVEAAPVAPAPAPAPVEAVPAPAAPVPAEPAPVEAAPVEPVPAETVPAPAETASADAAVTGGATTSTAGGAVAP